jgi:hypothetical protein
MYDGDFDDPAPFRAPAPAAKPAPKEPLSLKDAFAHVNSVMENAVTLRVYNAGIYSYYDFAQRQRTVHTTPTLVTPFADLDREVLVAARDKLVELGGQPPQLPPEANTLNKPVKGLNP